MVAKPDRRCSTRVNPPGIPILKKHRHSCTRPYRYRSPGAEWIGGDETAILFALHGDDAKGNLAKGWTVLKFRRDAVDFSKCRSGVVHHLDRYRIILPGDIFDFEMVDTICWAS